MTEFVSSRGGQDDMLVLSRKIGQGLVIALSADISPDLTVSELFKDGPIVIEFAPHRGGKRTKIAIHAPKGLTISRCEKPISNARDNPHRHEQVDTELAE